MSTPHLVVLDEIHGWETPEDPQDEPGVLPWLQPWLYAKLAEHDRVRAFWTPGSSLRATRRTP